MPGGQTKRTNSGKKTLEQFLVFVRERAGKLMKGLVSGRKRDLDYTRGAKVSALTTDQLIWNLQYGSTVDSRGFSYL